MKDSRTLEREKILSELEYPVHGLLLLAPRVGKTILGMEIIKKENCSKVLWVTSEAKLRDEKLPAEFDKWDFSELNFIVEITTYASLPKSIGHYDKIILDEWQHITERNCENLLNGKLTADSIMGLSGTDPKDAKKQRILTDLGLHILMDISIDKAVDKDLIADYQINLIEVELENYKKDVLVSFNNKSFYITEKQRYDNLTKSIDKHTVENVVDTNLETKIITIKGKNFRLKEFTPKFKCDKAYLILEGETSIGYIVLKGSKISGKYFDLNISNNDLYRKVPEFLIFSRLHLIYNLKSKLNVVKSLLSKLEGRSIIFSGSTEFADKISSCTYHSKSKDKDLNYQRFQEGKEQILSCVNMGGTGHDFTNVENFIIVQANSDKQGNTTQKLSRSLLRQKNYKAKIFIIVAKNTVDEIWVSSALENFDQNKIRKYEFV